MAFCRTVYGTSPMGDVIDIEADGLAAGLPDMLAVPDLATLRDLPWEPGVAHVLADAANPDGTPAAGERRARCCAPSPSGSPSSACAR